MKELPNPTLPLSSITWPKALFRRPSQYSESPGISPVAPAPHKGIAVSWARTSDEVRQAQRLRFNVFAGEMGARLDTTSPGHDVDIFDDFCEHLLVRDLATREVVGTSAFIVGPPSKMVVGSVRTEICGSIRPRPAARPGCAMIARPRRIAKWVGRPPP